jgi:DNA-binding response OmpR family regulator
MLSQVPVLVISGSPLAERARTLHPAVAGWLAKPFTREVLLAELKRVLGR